MFELRERWIEEVHDHLQADERVTCTDGYMDLAAIVTEIVDADADERRQKPIMVPNWQSLRVDLADTLERLGTELQTLIKSDGEAVLDALGKLVIPKVMPNGAERLIVEEVNRPQVRKTIRALAERLDEDDVTIAAWRDLLAACRSTKFREYSNDRIAFLRDTLFGLQKHRRHRDDYFGAMQSAWRVVADYPWDVYNAMKVLGGPEPQFEPTVNGVSGVSESDRISLSERLLCRIPASRDYVVWLRVDSAFLHPLRDLEFGAVTLYAAQLLAGVIHDHERSRQVFTVVPEELLTEEVARQQRDPEREGEFFGFEYRPKMVYARIVVADTERHLAHERARRLLGNILSYLDPGRGHWKILEGSLIFPNRANPNHSLEWGRKYPLEEPVYYQNDHVARKLAELKTSNRVITMEISGRLDPALRLTEELRNARTPEAVVVASVRAIEHCNSWTTRGEKEWGKFISTYLIDRATRISFLRRAQQHTFRAIFKTVPDPSPGAPPQLDLDRIRDEAKENGGPQTFDLEVCIRNVSTLSDIYADHPLWRPLAVLTSILRPDQPISDAINIEQERIRVCVERLTRARNAAIHGGPLSSEACESIADFAKDIAGQALYKVMESIVLGKSVSDYMNEQRESDVVQLRKLRKSGDHTHLFDA
ncbi:hypothetical protein [Nocardia tengchongensis]|uniref:hypothetical protein n=1 Tax=Nocardia tengchongensis TaxID=2055889 RepID=UPI0036CD68F2